MPADKIKRNWQLLLEQQPSPLQHIDSPWLKDKGIRLLIKRDDLLRLPLEEEEAAFCGNKWRKLKWNLFEAQKTGHSTLLTFGGAYSNHIAAVADAGSLFGFSTIGVIRGERPAILNPTLRKAQTQGMQLHFVSRSAYREKETTLFQSNLGDQFGVFYPLPEGGTNELALKGVAELALELEVQLSGLPDYFVGACGTGGTLSGLIRGFEDRCQIEGFPVLKGNFMEGAVKDILGEKPAGFNNWKIIEGYHFGGYAKFDEELLQFIRDFREQHQIQLGPIYTGKLAYGLFDRIKKGHYQAGSTIVMLHSGGLQGIKGFNERFGKKN